MRRSKSASTTQCRWSIPQKWLRRSSRSAPMWRPCSSTGFPRAPPGMVACQFHKSVAPFFYKSHCSRAESDRIYRSYTRCTTSGTSKGKIKTFSERDTSHVFRTTIWLRPLVPLACITRRIVLRQILLDRDPGALHRVMLAPAVRLQEQMDACISICFLSWDAAGSAFRVRYP